MLYKYICIYIYIYIYVSFICFSIEDTLSDTKSDTLGETDTNKSWVGVLGHLLNAHQRGSINSGLESHRTNNPTTLW